MKYFLCQTVSGAYSVISAYDDSFTSSYVFCKEITEAEAEKAKKCLKTLEGLLKRES